MHSQQEEKEKPRLAAVYLDSADTQLEVCELS